MHTYIWRCNTPLNIPDFLQTMGQINPLRHFSVMTLGLFIKDITLEATLINMAEILAIAICSAGIAIWMFGRRS